MQWETHATHREWECHVHVDGQDRDDDTYSWSASLTNCSDPIDPASLTHSVTQRYICLLEVRLIDPWICKHAGCYCLLFWPDRSVCLDDTDTALQQSKHIEKQAKLANKRNQKVSGTACPIQVKQSKAKLHWWHACFAVQCNALLYGWLFTLWDGTEISIIMHNALHNTHITWQWRTATMTHIISDGKDLYITRRTPS